ncbi:RagB/SusD family nutrient uptake outer membrane protein [Persicobacter sp. CCB-QB2]|uniref:RagB/SusD family nutrient uptake outer membrane protein n=1 Tax=Persicobacter sp. CCB-QB2 TaxID=1561025 RepID=UPI0006A96711|nr:RagB/SusD family nutrient uptake outer membrane protein [Persicobacter sp. CCB-QB2]
MKINIKRLFVIAFVAMFSSCVGDLDVNPIDPNLDFEQDVFKDITGYEQVLGKLYAGYHVAGQKGDDNESDVSTIPDGGMSSYLRNYWNLQELPTGEAMNAWGDGGLIPLQNGQWSADNQYVAGMFYRLFYMIALSNEFLSQSSDAKLDERGQGSLKEQVAQMRAEARLIRAISYYHGLDFYRKLPIITEFSNEAYPTPVSEKELFNFVIEELNAIEELLPEANMAEYGRMDKGTLWMVKAKMFLNAKVFTGEDNPVSGVTSLSEVIALTEKINAAYTFEENLLKLFSADNKEAKGIIHSVPLHPENTKGFSATQYVISAGTNGFYANHVGIAGSAGWGGNHATREIYDWFQDQPAGDMRGKTEDMRGMADDDKEMTDYTTFLAIYDDLDMKDPLNYVHGLNVTKFRNKNADGSSNGFTETYFVATDWPMFRLADSYMMYAEAVLRGGGALKQQQLSW